MAATTASNENENEKRAAKNQEITKMEWGREREGKHSARERDVSQVLYDVKIKFSHVSVELI